MGLFKHYSGDSGFNVLKESGYKMVLMHRNFVNSGKEGVIDKVIIITRTKVLPELDHN